MPKCYNYVYGCPETVYGDGNMWICASCIQDPVKYKKTCFTLGEAIARLEDFRESLKQA